MWHLLGAMNAFMFLSAQQRGDIFGLVIFGYCMWYASSQEIANRKNSDKKDEEND